MIYGFDCLLTVSVSVLQQSSVNLGMYCMTTSRARFYIPIKSSLTKITVCVRRVLVAECNVIIHRYYYGIIRVSNENDTWYCDVFDWAHKNESSVRINRSAVCAL